MSRTVVLVNDDEKYFTRENDQEQGFERRIIHDKIGSYLEIIVNWTNLMNFDEKYVFDVDEIVLKSIKNYFKDSVLSVEKKLEIKDDIEWIASNPEELKQFKGKYVAISENKILGSGKTSKEAFDEAKRKDPTCDPLIMLNSSLDSL